MNKEDREKLLDVAGFLQGWLAFKKPVPPEEVVRLHFDLVMEVLAKNNEVLDLVSKSPSCKKCNDELRFKNVFGELVACKDCYEGEEGV